MSGSNYYAGVPTHRPHRRRWPWVLVVLFLLGGLVFAGLKFYQKPTTSLTQSKTVTTKALASNAATKHFDETDFGIDLPAGWQKMAPINSPYQLYRWQSTDSRGQPGQATLEVYENNIPQAAAFNRVQIVSSADDRLSLEGSLSDNCSTFTKSTAAASYQVGVAAKWQGVDFLCDQSNTSRDRLGTSSTDGLNMVILKSPPTGQSHKFLFIYTNSDITPDYGEFSTILASVRAH